MSRGSEAAAPMAVILVELLLTRMHHPFRCCVAMRLRVETRDRCLSCARRSRSWIDPRPGSCYIRWTGHRKPLELTEPHQSAPAPPGRTTTISLRWHECEVPVCPLQRRFRRISGSSADIAQPARLTPSPWRWHVGCCKTIFAAQNNNIDSEMNAGTQHRFITENSES